MSIPLTGTLVPIGAFPGMEDAAIAGGVHVVANATARDAIPTAGQAAPNGVRKAGMLAITADDGKTWQLASDLTTWNPYQPDIAPIANIRYISAGSGQDVPDGGSISKPWATIVYALSQITPSESAIFTLIITDNHIEPVEIELPPFVVITGQGKNATLIFAGSWSLSAAWEGDQKVGGICNAIVGGALDLDLTQTPTGSGPLVSFYLNNVTAFDIVDWKATDWGTTLHAQGSEFTNFVYLAGGSHRFTDCQNFNNQVTTGTFGEAQVEFRYISTGCKYNNGLHIDGGSEVIDIGNQAFLADDSVELLTVEGMVHVELSADSYGANASFDADATYELRTRAKGVGMDDVAGPFPMQGLVDVQKGLEWSVLRAALELYVAPGAGDDSNPGTDPALPLDTLQGAYNKISPLLASSVVIHMASATGVEWVPPPAFQALTSDAIVAIVGDGAGQVGDDGFTELLADTAGSDTTSTNIYPSSGSFTDDEYLGYTLELTIGGNKSYRSIRNNGEGSSSDHDGIVPVRGISGAASGDAFRVLAPGCIFDLSSYSYYYQAAPVTQGPVPVALINLGFEEGVLNSEWSYTMFGCMMIGASAGLAARAKSYVGATWTNVRKALDEIFGSSTLNRWGGWGVTAPNGSLVPSIYNCNFDGFVVSADDLYLHNYYNVPGDCVIWGGSAPRVSVYDTIRGRLYWGVWGTPFLLRPSGSQFALVLNNTDARIENLNAVEFDCSGVSSGGGAIQAYDSRLAYYARPSPMFTTPNGSIDAENGIAVSLIRSSMLAVFTHDAIWEGDAGGLRMANSQLVLSLVGESPGAIFTIYSSAATGTYARQSSLKTDASFSYGNLNLNSASVGMELINSDFAATSGALSIQGGGAESGGVGLRCFDSDVYVTVPATVAGDNAFRASANSTLAFRSTLTVSGNAGALELSENAQMQCTGTSSITATGENNIGAKVDSGASLVCTGLCTIDNSYGIDTNGGKVFGAFDITAVQHGIVAYGAASVTLTTITINAGAKGIVADSGANVGITAAAPSITAVEDGVDVTGGGNVVFRVGTSVTISAGGAELRTGPGVGESGTYAAELAAAGDTFANANSGSTISRKT